MGLLSRNRRRRLALFAAAPITAGITIFGVSSPASAWVVQNGCSNFQICFYGNTDFAPTSQVLNIGRERIPDWLHITPAGTACTQGGGNGQNWNDCASSVKDRMTAFDTCVYSNVDYNNNGGTRLLILHGENIPNLGDFGFNDIISSSQYTSTPSC